MIFIKWLNTVTLKMSEEYLIIKQKILCNVYYGYEWEDVIVTFYYDTISKNYYRNDRISWCNDWSYEIIVDKDFNIEDINDTLLNGECKRVDYCIR